MREFAFVLAQTAPNFVAILERITAGIRPIATPIAGLALTIVFLLMIGSPIMPEAASQNKGAVMRVLLALVFIAIIPELVSWMGTLGVAA
jgi:hypothetical protein